MLSSTVYSLGNPGTFDITDKNDPQYYIARFSHEMSKNFYDLQQAGFEWRQGTQTDFGSIETELDTFLGSVTTWLDSAVTASMADDPIPALPTMPDFHPAYAATDGSVSVWWLVIKFMLWYVLLKLKKSLEGSNDTTEVANILRRALLSENEASEEYSNIVLLAHQAIRIILEHKGGVQDFLYTSEAD